ncbi:hypothetical protein OSB04_019457 [Centaurea solstitialis]|uniref:Uncharacterized protein n=1 Tax=Centaurea solstitialis TaxID=347529 RepID=A0AA38SQE1_9ASTR|nr:hypothetical protein OSB04_019457 [Centaurea solstitialis]
MILTICLKVVPKFHKQLAQGICQLLESNQENLVLNQYLTRIYGNALCIKQIKFRYIKGASFFLGNPNGILENKQEREREGGCRSEGGRRREIAGEGRRSSGETVAGSVHSLSLDRFSGDRRLVVAYAGYGRRRGDTGCDKTDGGRLLCRLERRWLPVFSLVAMERVADGRIVAARLATAKAGEAAASPSTSVRSSVAAVVVCRPGDTVAVVAVVVAVDARTGRRWCCRNRSRRPTPAVMYALVVTPSVMTGSGVACGSVSGLWSAAGIELGGQAVAVATPAAAVHRVGRRRSGCDGCSRQIRGGCPIVARRCWMIKVIVIVRTVLLYFCVIKSLDWDFEDGTKTQILRHPEDLERIGCVVWVHYRMDLAYKVGVELDCAIVPVVVEFAVEFRINLIPTPMREFDVKIGMDRWSRNQAIVECAGQRVRIQGQVGESWL